MSDDHGLDDILNALDEDVKRLKRLAGLLKRKKNDQQDDTDLFMARTIKYPPGSHPPQQEHQP